jgi:hypothetical protein
MTHRRTPLLAGLLAVFALHCGAGTGSHEGDGSAHPDATADATHDDAAPSGDAATDGTSTPQACPCFEGPGTYCESAVAAQATAAGCVAADASASGTRLLACDDHGWSASATCASGCESGETGASSACSLPECSCFVQTSWCGASAARHGLTLSPPCRVPLTPDHDSDILGCDANHHWIVLQACPNGCNEAPDGTPDTCVGTRTPQDPGWAPCAHNPTLLKAGLHPEASDRLRCMGITSGQITQTIGYATASAGYHAPDGTVNGLQYTAAVDLSVSGMSATQIRTLLTHLGENGFAAWYRDPGYDGWPSSDAEHVHAVFAGVVMKSELRGQVRDYLSGLNGLASHAPYHFWQPTAAIDDIIRLLFSRNYTP